MPRKLVLTTNTYVYRGKKLKKRGSPFLRRQTQDKFCKTTCDIKDFFENDVVGKKRENGCGCMFDVLFVTN
jgi:hypothetical protein